MRRQDTGSRASPPKKTTWLITTLIITAFFLIPCAAQARPLKTTIHQVILDPAKYKGKTLEVEGLVKAMKIVTAKKGRVLTSFELTADNSPAAVEVLTRKKPAYQEDDYVRVTGKFRQKAGCPPCCWRGVIDASRVTKVAQTICK